MCQPGLPGVTGMESGVAGRGDRSPFIRVGEVVANLVGQLA